MSDIKQILSIYPLSAIMRKYNVEPERRNIKCPFPSHDDPNASFKFYDNESFFCFGCKASGDAISFIANMEGIDNGTATKRYLSLVGNVDVSYAPKQQYKKPKPDKDWSHIYQEYVKLLDRDKNFYIYLNKRCLPNWTAKMFGLYGMQRAYIITKELKAKFSNQDLIDSGLYREGMYPIFCKPGLVFSYPGYKYLSYRCYYGKEFRKLHGVSQIAWHYREGSSTLIVTESIIDAISYYVMYGKDGMDLLSLNGTQCRVDFPEIFRPYKKVLLCLDNDTAGHDAVYGKTEKGKRYKGILEISDNTGTYSIDELKESGCKDWNELLMKNKS
jgi:DNA primase